MASTSPSIVPPWLRVLVAYAGLACVLTWPLPLHLRTHFLGDPGGDLGTYVWNMWIFRHELLRHGHLPVSTQHLFADSGGADFTLHNYAPIAGLAGAPLIGSIGVVGAFNAILLAFITASGFCTFLLARRVGMRRFPAWLAGALFTGCPAIVARETAHFSLVIGFALPLFLWALLRTLHSLRYRDATLVGGIVAAAYYSDAYYGVYCAAMGAFVLVWRFTRAEWPTTVIRAPAFERILSFIIGFFAALVAWRLLTGPQGLAIGPVRIGLTTLYTPILILYLSTVLRLWLIWRPTLRLSAEPSEIRRLWRLGLVSGVTCLILLAPQLIGLAIRFVEGRMPATPIFWRSSPRGVDLLAYFVPNPNHPWFGAGTRLWFMPPQADAFPEFVGSYSLISIAIIAVGIRFRLVPRLWLAFTGLFALLSLGPFVYVAGVNTYVVGPWAFLRFVPVIGMARSPSRFAIVAVLGLSLLTAYSIDRLSRMGRSSLWFCRLSIAVLVFELFPAPRTLYSASVPDVYQLVSVNGDEEARLLELPTGIRDGTSSLGDFSASSQYFQTRHRRPLIGGYLSRVSPWRRQENQRCPVLRALFALSEGSPVPPDRVDDARAARDAFLRRSCVKFVLVDKNRTGAELQSVAVDMLGLTSLYADQRYALFTPTSAPPCDPPVTRKF